MEIIKLSLIWTISLNSINAAVGVRNTWSKSDDSRLLSNSRLGKSYGLFYIADKYFGLRTEIINYPILLRPTWDLVQIL